MPRAQSPVGFSSTGFWCLVPQIFASAWAIVRHSRAEPPRRSLNQPSKHIMASLENLHDLFVSELRDIYDAEQQLTKALPLMAQAANARDLKQGFETHLQQTREHVQRLEQIFSGLGVPPSGKTCKAMQGLVAEAKEMIDQDADPEVMDAGLIVAAQKVEHYEIAGYGSVSTFGRVLHYDNAVKLLKATIAEEEATDRKLSELASKVNVHAEAADQA